MLHEDKEESGQFNWEEPSLKKFLNRVESAQMVWSVPGNPNRTTSPGENCGCQKSIKAMWNCRKKIGMQRKSEQIH